MRGRAIAWEESVGPGEGGACTLEALTLPFNMGPAEKKRRLRATIAQGIFLTGTLLLVATWGLWKGHTTFGMLCLFAGFLSLTFDVHLWWFIRRALRNNRGSN